MKPGRIIIIIALSILALGSCVKQLPEKPNILFITTDYHAWEDVPELTPVLDMPALTASIRKDLFLKITIVLHRFASLQDIQLFLAPIPILMEPGIM